MYVYLLLLFLENRKTMSSNPLSAGTNKGTSKKTITSSPQSVNTRCWGRGRRSRRGSWMCPGAPPRPGWAPPACGPDTAGGTGWSDPATPLHTQTRPCTCPPWPPAGSPCPPPPLSSRWTSTPARCSSLPEAGWMTPSAHRRDARSPARSSGHRGKINSVIMRLPVAVEAVCDCVCICDGGEVWALHSASSGTTVGGFCSGPGAFIWLGVTI